MFVCVSMHAWLCYSIAYAYKYPYIDMPTHQMPYGKISTYKLTIQENKNRDLRDDTELLDVTETPDNSIQRLQSSKENI